MDPSGLFSPHEYALDLGEAIKEAHEAIAAGTPLKQAFEPVVWWIGLVSQVDPEVGQSESQALDIALRPLYNLLNNGPFGAALGNFVPRNDCVDVANGLADILNDLGIPYQDVYIKTSNGRPITAYVQSLGQRITIGPRGWHVAIKVGSRIWDAATDRAGESITEYMKNLNLHGGELWTYAGHLWPEAGRALPDK